MENTIYYFTGTGNCLAVARKINEKSKEKSELIPITGYVDKPQTKGDRVGFVFPVYCHKVPEIVKQFILRMEFTSSPYIFAVATHNVEPGQSLFDIKKLLTKKGQFLSIGIAIEMPGNAIETKPNVELERLSALDQKTKEVVDLIEAQKKGIINGNSGLIEKIRNKIVCFFAWNYIFAPRRYKISNNCTGCNICGRVCPVKNIHMSNNRPIWEKKCAVCLACYHWCPNNAIYLDNSVIKKRRQYHHPDITINDMLIH
jgi:ferredoxin